METSSKLLPLDQDLVSRITAALADRFTSFGGGGREHPVSPVSAAFAGGSPVFALGVNIEDVVWATLRMAMENS